jgi:serine/threonine-protein kinase
VLVGSPVYMAPELLAGQSASASSDLYALAVLSFELLAGRAPFAAGSMGALLRAVAQAAPPPLATLRPDWPEAVAARLDRWVAPLLAKDPAQRPADGAAWAALSRAAARELWPEASPA